MLRWADTVARSGIADCYAGSAFYHMMIFSRRITFWLFDVEVFSDLPSCRRFFRSTLQPIAENLEYNPVSIAARYRSNYLGSVSLPTQTQAASYSVSSSDEPTRGGSTPDAVPGQALDPNRVPPEGSLDRQGSGKVSKVRVEVDFPIPSLPYGILLVPLTVRLGMK